MKAARESYQWSLQVIVYHGPGFGHRIETVEHSRGRDQIYRNGGSWNGLGIPEPVLTDLTTTVNAVIVEHLVSRYGVEGELPVKWAGEPDPF